MSNATLREILLTCLALEKTAADIYSAISEQTDIDAHKAFWQDVSSDEKRHVGYWERLLALEEKGTVPNPFDRPTRVKTELEAMKTRIDEFLAEEKAFSDISEAILAAFRLESSMLHPAFFILFRSLRKEAGDVSPEDDYGEHIEKFSQFVGQFLNNKPEIELLGDILLSMWEHGTEMADQFDQIKALRGLLPICASCKKIRDDQGYWKEIESYIGERSEARFTHSICPACTQELYPEFFRKRE